MRRKDRIIKVYAQEDQATSLEKAKQIVAMQKLTSHSQSLGMYETAETREQEE